MAETYVEFFRRATGHPQPHGYQRRIAERGLPALVQIPPGYGKTAAIALGWLWRRRYHPDPTIRSNTPRRLVIALPQRSLADQTANEIFRWLDNLGISSSDLGLHVVMGGRSRANRPWRLEPDKDSILVATVDIVASKALVRAYGVGRNAFPIDAALVWNDAHIVVDEVQGAPASTVTFRQVEAFRLGDQGGAGQLTCMSATIPQELIDTVDNPYPSESSIVGLGPDDETPDLTRRRTALRQIRRLPTNGAHPMAIAQQARARHRERALTLVILNTVKAAREVHRELSKLAPNVDALLLHSQFRPVDRVKKFVELATPPPAEGRIVVATQVVEAGIDIDAAVVVTEVAPWNSIVQRSGRCNRRGLTDAAELWWVRAEKDAPYEPADLDEAEGVLTELESQWVSNEQLLAAEVTYKPLNPLTLRRSDFLSLFDTSPDLSGHDLDVAPYIRDTDDLSVELCWLEWAGATPPAATALPDAAHRCRVPVREVASLARTRNVWRFDPVDTRWRVLDARSPARPGEVLLLDASAGGYRAEVGFDPASKTPVEVTSESTLEVDASTPMQDAMAGEATSFCPEWIPLDQHLIETGEEARRLVADLDLTDTEKADVVLAARVHDIGKAHPIWQDALCATASAEETSEKEGGRPWAKSGSSGRLRYAGIETFRHELASLMLLDGPLAGLLKPAHDPDLVRYLVTAHHGKLRVQIRDPKPSGGAVLGLIDGAEVPIPAVLDEPGSILQTSLVRLGMGSGGDSDLQSWPDLVASLIERYGVFRLAYLEMLVRIADWRASALHSRSASS